MNSRVYPAKVFNLLRLKSKPVGPLIVFVKSDFHEKDLRKLLRNAHVLNHSDEYSVFSGTYLHTVVNFLGTGSGSASLLSALYEVASPNLECMVRIGACGGLGAADVDEIVVSKSCFCVDSVSSTLAAESKVTADAVLIDRITKGFSRGGIRVACNDVASVDAMYLFDENVKKAEAEGARCWDLETATLLAFGKTFGIRTVAVLEVVSDNKGNSLEFYPPIRRLDFVRNVLETLAVGKASQALTSAVT
jgi:uridine phosphorylase